MTKSTLDVLIIEDDVWLAEQFDRTLASGGFRTKCVSNGHIAMDMIDEALPRVIILDMLLTGGTGITLLHELQSYQDTGGIPIILCSNLASQIRLDDVAHYGVRRILDKTTMHPDDILAAVRSVLL